MCTETDSRFSYFLEENGSISRIILKIIAVELTFQQSGVPITEIGVKREYHIIAVWSQHYRVKCTLQQTRCVKIIPEMLPEGEKIILSLTEDLITFP